MSRRYYSLCLFTWSTGFLAMFVAGTWLFNILMLATLIGFVACIVEAIRCFWVTFKEFKKEWGEFLDDLEKPDII